MAAAQLAATRYRWRERSAPRGRVATHFRPQMEGSDDVHVHKFSISMGGKTLFKDCPLSLAHGRRYGLIGPNGCGKSTLMTAIGKQTNEEIMAGIPPQMDILLVEQEVAASKTISAVEMVVLADERRTALLKEEKELKTRPARVLPLRQTAKGEVEEYFPDCDSDDDGSWSDNQEEEIKYTDLPE